LLVVLAFVAVACAVCDECSLRPTHVQDSRASKVTFHERGAGCGSSILDTGTSLVPDHTSSYSCHYTDGSGATYNEYFVEAAVTAGSVVDCNTITWGSVTNTQGTSVAPVTLTINVWDGDMAAVSVASHHAVHRWHGHAGGHGHCDGAARRLGQQLGHHLLDQRRRADLLGQRAVATDFAGPDWHLQRDLAWLQHCGHGDLVPVCSGLRTGPPVERRRIHPHPDRARRFDFHLWWPLPHSELNAQRVAPHPHGNPHTQPPHAHSLAHQDPLAQPPLSCWWRCAQQQQQSRSADAAGGRFLCAAGCC